MAVNPKAHGDHNPKHGGLVFTAADSRHNIEGKLVAPGRFCIWLYDEYTQPISSDQLKQTKGTVQWGAHNRSPRTPITLAKDGQRLEALPPGLLTLPTTLILRIVFPDDLPAGKTELFTFHIARFSSDSETTQQPATDTNSIDHSGSGHNIAAPGDKSADTLERHPAH